ncbi:MAG: hypothetical protein V1664_03200 [Candidatus Uhrbacteria bacterium]
MLRRIISKFAEQIIPAKIPETFSEILVVRIDECVPILNAAELIVSKYRGLTPRTAGD